MRLPISVFRPIYFLLYHQFSWSYDFIADLVSLGRWREWVKVALPYLSGRVLELGFGPGHLQLSLIENNYPAFGLDESFQMARQARRNIHKKRLSSQLTRGYAQYLPYSDQAFDSIVATFPAPYIYDPDTLQEIRRVLAPDGQLIILPMAWLTGKHTLEIIMAWLFQISGIAPESHQVLPIELSSQIIQAGFKVRTEIITIKESQVLVLLAEKHGES
jgi:ubiquinone/menaquinone biosynthesis C-methylase UbiE